MRIGALLADYRAGRTDPSAVAARVIAACAASRQPIWITRVADAELLAAARALDAGDRSLPLYGIPFAVKDNIDVDGLPTTGALPHAVRVPQRHAAVVQRLVAAGALVVGKTNLDQLATGLVGTRTPYGACASVADPERISGGSSSGSAVAVALGQVAFALGTDTAGSGRVPAAYNGLVGLKPTGGLLSVDGVLPACASLDCVSVFTHDVADAARVLELTRGYDPGDPWSRPAQVPARAVHGRVGVPLPGQLEFTEPDAERAWEAALARAATRFDLVPVDVGPLLQIAPMLYATWVAERTADLAVHTADPRQAAGVDPTVAAIVGLGAAVTGPEVFEAQHRLAALRRAAESVWTACDALLMPTVPGHPTHAEVAADPIGVNAGLGRYTNFVNLADLCGVAVPGPTRDDGLPAGVTFLAPAFADELALEHAAAFLGEPAVLPRPGSVRLVVVGAHLSGMALNNQLTDRGARRVAVTTTAPRYGLYALAADGPVARPGLVRRPGTGAAIPAEVWELTPAALGELLTLVPAPLAIGRVELADGRWEAGFVCEAHALESATDITHVGGWRAYMDGVAA